VLDHNYHTSGIGGENINKNKKKIRLGT